MKPTPYSAFICGLLFSHGVSMFVQDLRGLDAHIEHLRYHWVDFSPAWGAGIAIFAAWQFLRIVFSYEREKKRRSRA